MAQVDGICQIESVETKSGKVLLYKMDVRFPEGTVTGILGPCKFAFVPVERESIHPDLNCHVKC